jgi:hypothetical protein
MAIQFYRKQNDKNLYETGSNRVIGATEFGKGAGFQEVKMPQGAVAINGAQYKDKASQQANFANVTPIGNTLYGVPKTITSGDLQTGASNLSATPPEPAAPTVQNILAERAGEMSQGANDTIKMLQAQQAEADKRIKEQQTRLADYEKQEAGLTADFGKVSIPFREELQKANNDKFEIERQIKQSISLADDLQTYSKMMNDELTAEASQPGMARVRQGSMQNVKDTYTSKIATAQAAMAAIKGNVGLVNEYTDRGISAIESDRNDKINYLSFVNEILQQNKSLALDYFDDATGMSDKSISDQISVYQQEVETIKKNKETIVEVMSSPATAVIAHNAGVLITDTPEQMANKINKYYAMHPEETYEKSAEMIEFLFAKQGGYAGSFMDFKRELNADWEPLKDEDGNVTGILNTSTGQVTGGNLNRPQRNNNPLNIKLGGATRKWVEQGAATVESAQAADGGNFLVFQSAEAGFEAAKDLLFNSGVYSGLTVDGAMRKWSGNGYGGEIVSFGNKKLSALSDSEKDQLVQKMATREGFYANGYTGNNSGGLSPVAQQLVNGSMKISSLTGAEATKYIKEIAAAGLELPKDDALISTYAEEYASTGKMPTSVSEDIRADVAQAAKDMPKTPGQFIDNTTGVFPQKLSSSLQDGLTALMDLQSKLAEADKLFNSINTGLLGGTFGGIVPSVERTAYLNLRSEIVDLISRARTGAALTASEEAFYTKKLPGTFNQMFFLGTDGSRKITDLRSSLRGILDTKLASNGVSIVGYNDKTASGMSIDPSKFDDN